MKITKDEVLYVARLARLDLDDESIERFAGQIDEILGYIDKLNQVETEGIRPTSHAIFLTNAFRDDTPGTIRPANILSATGRWPMPLIRKTAILWFRKSSGDAFEKDPLLPNFCACPVKLIEDDHFTGVKLRF